MPTASQPSSYGTRWQISTHLAEGQTSQKYCYRQLYEKVTKLEGNTDLTQSSILSIYKCQKTTVVKFTQKGHKINKKIEGWIEDRALLLRGRQQAQLSWMAGHWGIGTGERQPEPSRCMNSLSGALP